MKMRNIRVIIGGITAAIVMSSIASPISYACEPESIMAEEASSEYKTYEEHEEAAEASEEPAEEHAEEPAAPEEPEVSSDDMYIPAPEAEPEETPVIAEEVQEEDKDEVPEEVKEEVPEEIREEVQEETKEEVTEDNKEPDLQGVLDDMFISVPVGTPEDGEEEKEDKEEPAEIEAEETEDKEEPAEIKAEDAEDKEEPAEIETEVTEDKAESEDPTEAPDTEKVNEEAEEVIDEETPEDPIADSNLINTYRKAAVDKDNPQLGEVVLTYEVYDNGVIRLTRSDREGNVYKEEFIDGERYDALTAAIEKRQEAIRKLEEANNLAETIDEMSIEQLMEIYLNMSTATADSFDGSYKDYTEGADNRRPKSTEEYLNDKATKVIKEAGKKAVEKLIKQLPVNDFYINTLKGIIGGIFGLEDDTVKLEDLMAQNAKDKKELAATIEKEIAIAKRENIDVTSIENYGNALDTFTDLADRRAKTIIEIRDDEDLSEAQKAIQIAELIGDSSDWRKGTDAGSIIVAMESAAKCFKGGKASDPDSRDLYNIIYEFKAHDSLFSGEAMNRAEGLIQLRVQGFIRNCQVVVECFKAHQTVAALTQEQVDSLDPKTRAIYDKIKSENKDIGKQLKNIVTLFFGNENSKFEGDHTGIFTAADDYYKKERTVYIDRGTKNIRLKEQLLKTHGGDYMKADNKGCDRDAVDSAVTKAGLTKEDIQKIAAMAKARNMTIKEYLSSVGFDTSNIGSGVLAIGSYEDKYNPILGGLYGEGYDYRGVEGYTTSDIELALYDIKTDTLIHESLSKHECAYGLWIDFGTKIEPMHQSTNIYTFQVK